MAAIKMMQGDSYSIYLDLKIDGKAVVPNMISEIEITVGDAFRKLYSSGEVNYDFGSKQWYFTPTQEETLSMKPNSYEVQVRIKFQNGINSSVKGASIGRLTVIDAQSEAVI